eukprot:s7574_g4.t1
MLHGYQYLLEIWMMLEVCEIWTLPEVCEIWLLPEVSEIWMLFEAYGIWRLLSAVWVLTSISTEILMWMVSSWIWAFLHEVFCASVPVEVEKVFWSAPGPELRGDALLWIGRGVVM